MKKVLAVVAVVAVALAFSFSANAEEATVKAKTKVEGDTAKTVVTEKAGGVVEKTTVTETPGEVKVKEEVKVKTGIATKEGGLKKYTVKLDSFKENEDYIYVLYSQKVLKLKQAFNDSTKKNVLKKVKGDTITIYSTHPLELPEVEKLAVIRNAE